MPRTRPGAQPQNNDVTPAALQRLRTENQDLRNKLEAAGKEATRLKAEVTTSGKELEKSKGQLQESKDALARSKKDLAESKKELAESKRGLAELQKELVAARKQAQADQVRSLADRGTLEAELKAARETAEELKAGIAEEKKARKAELEAVQAVKKALREEKAEVKRLLAEKQEQLKEVETLNAELEARAALLANAEDLDAKFTALLELNRKLQEELDGARDHLKAQRSRVDESDARVAAAVAKAEKRLTAEKQALETTLEQRLADNASLVKQLESAGKTPFLSPEQVSGLLDRFYKGVSRDIAGLDVRESEIRLKVGFAGISPEDGGIVVPTTANIAEVKDGLSEVVLKLGRKDLSGR
ncbi:MAG: hypothetical protein JJT88_06535 [Gammaproteobacteria bacterium]|nr:hypothetical protein [Gammaproteobacteria bacterium]